jgi:HD superfamily phosphodiesterase
MDASVIAPFPRQLALYCGCLVAVAAALAAALVVTGGAPRLPALLVLAGLAVFSMHRTVVLKGDGISFSPVTMVFMAAVAVFDHDHALSGAVFVGLAGGLFLPSLHRRTWAWIPFNAANWACSVGGAVLVYASLRGLANRSLPTSLIALVLAAVTFVAVNWVLLVLSYLVERHRAPREVFAELVAQLLGDIPFALVGFLVGRLYISYGPAILILVFAPILIAREMFASSVRVKESHEETVHMLIRALEAKDRYTAGHAERVANYARYMGESLNFMPSRMERLRFAALMHDIGKLVVPNQLLNKPGRLTADEFEHVRIHEKVSVQMLSHIDFLQPIAGAGHSDNTRFDPDDADHPIEPYIVMIADAYDAMTSTRAYRKALTQEVAFQELRDKAGIQFHPACVEALISAIERRGEKHGAGHEQSQEFRDAPDVGVGSAGLGDLLPSEAG